MKGTRNNHQARSGRPLPPGRPVGKLQDASKAADLPGALAPEASGGPAAALGADDQPTPPGIPRMPPSAEKRPGDQIPVPEAPAPAAEDLSDLEWMPLPNEDRIAKFLSDVAEMAPPSIREREDAAPAFVLATPVSPEEAERKKARAEPFWSEVLAAPMAAPASDAASTPAKRGGRKRRILRVVIIAIILVALASLVGLALLTHPGLLHG